MTLACCTRWRRQFATVDSRQECLAEKVLLAPNRLKTGRIAGTQTGEWLTDDAVARTKQVGRRRRGGEAPWAGRGPEAPLLVIIGTWCFGLTWASQLTRRSAAPPPGRAGGRSGARGGTRRSRSAGAGPAGRWRGSAAACWSPTGPAPDTTPAGRRSRRSR